MSVYEEIERARVAQQPGSKAQFRQQLISAAAVLVTAAENVSDQKPSDGRGYIWAEPDHLHTVTEDNPVRVIQVTPTGNVIPPLSEIRLAVTCSVPPRTEPGLYSLLQLNGNLKAPGQTWSNAVPAWVYLVRQPRSGLESIVLYTALGGKSSQKRAFNLGGGFPNRFVLRIRCSGGRVVLDIERESSLEAEVPPMATLTTQAPDSFDLSFPLNIQLGARTQPHGQTELRALVGQQWFDAALYVNGITSLPPA